MIELMFEYYDNPPTKSSAARFRSSSRSAGCSASTQATTSDSPARVGVAEFATVDGHIAGAVNIPVQQADFAARVAQLDPDTTYAVYCRSCNRSQPAVAAMEEAGITTIYELDSGTTGWTAEGQPLTR